MGFDKIWIRINQFHLAMATPFRRPYVSWRVVSSIGELRGCTISGTRQHAGQAIAPIPRSSGDGPVEIKRPPISELVRSKPKTTQQRFLETLRKVPQCNNVARGQAVGCIMERYTVGFRTLLFLPSCRRNEPDRSSKVLSSSGNFSHSRRRS